MKRFFVILFTVLTGLSLCACRARGQSVYRAQVNPQPTDTQASTELTHNSTEASYAPAEPTQAPTEPTQAPAEPTQAPTEPTQAPAEPTQAPTEPTQAPTEILLDTDYYTLSLPLSWGSDCEYWITEGESYNYTVVFCERASNGAGAGGFLFSLALNTPFDDYTYHPSYSVLGSLDVYRIGSYNLVAFYPTDVQYTEENAATYNRMVNEISGVLESITFKDECTFSKDPIPIERVPDADASPVADFYSELYRYTVSTCVNYTEWWAEPTLSDINSSYYLGTVTWENYSEKMEEAKQTVDSIYNASYWDIRFDGDGTLRIGLYVTSNEELFLCYDV